ncbi:hypothetical protein BN2475_140032 [Paraburkholderia ribeironis]|uniref:Uncharacterized protein n=1 Tax=Paraburkholderia ribeironis TaxID=1247936 RepID=A0A1N7RSU8_9BURK|nr:hypothetical protein BN2475_140032 [Paraburkholderia ribeironis]
MGFHTPCNVTDVAAALEEIAVELSVDGNIVPRPPSVHAAVKPFDLLQGALPDEGPRVQE